MMGVSLKVDVSGNRSNEGFVREDRKKGNRGSGLRLECCLLWKGMKWE